MDIKTEFRIVTITLFFLQVFFTLSACYGFVYFYESGKLIDLSASILLIYVGVHCYALGGIYRKEFGLKIQQIKHIDLSGLSRFSRRKIIRKLKKQK